MKSNKKSREVEPINNKKKSSLDVKFIAAKFFGATHFIHFDDDLPHIQK